MTSEITAYSKINLTLDLTGRLPNGYHGIFTVMQTVSAGDKVAVTVRDGDGITVSCNEKKVPTDNRNTAYKAAQYYLAEARLSKAVEIYIEKIIPSEAGLGGGSADAAAVLKILDGMFPGRVSREKLFDAALSVGADVPFCLAGGTRLCQNVGEVMTELPQFKSYVVLAKPVEGVSTKAAYEKFDAGEKLVHPDNNSFLYYAATGKYNEALRFAGNIFEELAAPEAGSGIKKVMYDCGAYYSAMSGSGSAYFGLFDSEENAVLAAGVLGKTLPFAVCCKAV